jgi:hypothetical protein
MSVDDKIWRLLRTGALKEQTELRQQIEQLEKLKVEMMRRAGGVESAEWRRFRSLLESDIAATRAAAATAVVKATEATEAEVDRVRTATKTSELEALRKRMEAEAELERLRGGFFWQRADAVPPSAEKFLSLVVSPKRLEEALGDLEQGFHRLNQRHGRPHAVRWYYWHVAGIALGGLFRWRWLLLFFTSN